MALTKRHVGSGNEIGQRLSHQTRQCRFVLWVERIWRWLIEARAWCLRTRKDNLRHKFICLCCFPLCHWNTWCLNEGPWTLFPIIPFSIVVCGLGPVHTSPFSNENGAVLLRFQKDLRPHLSFSYRFRPSTLQRSSREKPHGTVCSPFWILTIEWAGARSCLFGWRHRFQIASFSSSTLENSVFKKHRFQIAPLWRAFSNDSVFGDRFRRCSVDDSRIRRKTAPFSFENGLVWKGP